ncbi:phage portal protein [Caudoviricetes sp.]|nr:phage portal protein [Caudoviricetes sp.]UOF82749.1 phage portal protein [Caudoviricetes sp.]
MGELKINEPCAAYVEMAHHWRLIEDLRGGTPRMRERSTLWLPQEDGESNAQHENRLKRSVLYEGYTDTVDKLATRPFDQNISIRGTVPQGLGGLEFLESVDGAGTTLDQFASDLIRDLVDYGRWHVMVDMPNLKNVRTRRQQLELGARPYFLRVCPSRIIGWRTKRVGRQEITTQIRITETTVVPDGAYGERVAERVRVWTDSSWELYEKQTSKEGKEVWAKLEDGENPFGFVPILSAYTKKGEAYVSRPALAGLAWLNLVHWQSYSDQRNLLRVARVPQMMIVGITSEEVEKESHIAVSRVWKSTMSDAKAFYVEHSGKAIEAGETDLRNIEQRMQVLGLQPLVESASHTTAVARTMDESRTHSKLGSWCLFTSIGLTRAFKLAAAWLDEKVDKDFEVKIFNDFELSARTAQDLQMLLQACVAGKVSDELFLMEAKRRGAISERTNVQEELKKMERQQAELEAKKKKPVDGSNGSNNSQSES